MDETSNFVCELFSLIIIQLSIYLLAWDGVKILVDKEEHVL